MPSKTSYPGGKASDGVYQLIINQIPPHRVYIEPFLGGGAILRKKRLASISIGVDADPKVTRSTPAIAGGAAGVSIINGDAISFLEQYPFVGDEFIYADPPYLLYTRRRSSPIYAYEFNTEAEHAALLNLLLSIPCAIALSGYWSNLYGQKLQNWRCLSYLARTRGGSTATEYLWMNYPEPFELHDYRYLGTNYRDRERIKKKKTRWVARLRRMNRLERLALLEAISTVRTAATGAVITPPDPATPDLMVPADAHHQKCS